MVKTKLAKLALLYCRKFMKNSIKSKLIEHESHALEGHWTHSDRHNISALAQNQIKVLTALLFFVIAGSLESTY